VAGSRRATPTSYGLPADAARRHRQPLRCGDLAVIIYSARQWARLALAGNGYDTKYAMHALRLGLQGVELLTTGRIALPIPEPDRGYLRSMRRGERSLSEVLEAISDAEMRPIELRGGPGIPDQPDRNWVDDWLHRSYQSFWATLG
jgi:hypothetical protein